MFKKIFLILVVILSIHSISNADCLFNCSGFPGTTCINGVCVPLGTTPTPDPNPAPVPSIVVSTIMLDAVPNIQIVPQIFDCNTMNLNSLKIYLRRKTPPPMCSYYSNIFFFYEDLKKETKTDYFFARKDFLNKYVFLYNDPNKTQPIPQSMGADFVFNVWENPAFTDFIKTKTCAELKSLKVYFGYGISIKGDCSDYEGAIFTFR